MDVKSVNKLKILALDDDPVVQEYIKITLKNDNILVFASSIREFYEKLNSFNPHIFLLDVNLPDGDGITLCTKIKSIPDYSDSFVIILTSKNDRKTIEYAYSQGADEYIRKPFIQYELLAKIKILDHIRTVRESLINAYQNQLDQNVQLFKLSEFIKKTLISQDRDMTLKYAEVLPSIIDLSYIEIIKVKNGVALGVMQKQLVNDAVITVFKEIEKNEHIFNIDNDIKFFSIKRGGQEIHHALLSIKFNNSIFGYILIERLIPFTHSDGEIISLFHDYINLLNERILFQNEISRKNEEYRKEINIIRKLEAARLPDFSVIEGYDTSFAFMPAQDLSGDFFDGFFIDEDIYQIVLCDISGHGIASSYVGSQIRTMFREKSLPGKKPSEIVREINSQLSENIPDQRYYCTAQLVQIFLDTSTIIYLSAGHPEAVSYRNSTKEFITWKTKSPVIGLFKDESYYDDIIALSSGDFLFMYTDGLIEEHSQDTNSMFGIQRVMNSLGSAADMTSNEIIHCCLGDLYEFNGYRPQNDDITLICIKKH